jgi:2-methylcitrate dehydratase PrpD
MARNTQVSADHHAPPVTDILARHVAGHASRGWSDAVEHEALRTWLNWVGCAIGATGHESVQAALAAMQAFDSAPQASLLGRSERVDMGAAALINGISSHTFDFDDTHLKTIIHPAGPVASALLAGSTPLVLPGVAHGGAFGPRWYGTPEVVEQWWSAGLSGSQGTPGPSPAGAAR